MPINPDAVGETGGPVTQSWTSKDALLYAVGIGAGTGELPFTTENTKDTPQRVFPTFAVIIGGGGTPVDRVGSFNPALMVHGEQGIELLDEIPPDGQLESHGRIAGIWDKGSAAVIEIESEAVNAATGKTAAAYAIHSVLPRRRRLGRRPGPLGEGGISRRRAYPPGHLRHA